MTVNSFICQPPDVSGLGVKCGALILKFADDTVLVAETVVDLQCTV